MEKQIAEDVFKKFSNLEGNQHICTENALIGILKVLNDYKPARVLEFGIGIGCMTYGILKWIKSQNGNCAYYGTEDNDFCINALNQNLKEFKDEPYFKWGESFESDTSTLYDLVIIDGPANIENGLRNLAKGGIIFIEGYRENQIKVISDFNKSRNYVIYRQYSLLKQRAYGPFKQGYQKGYTVIKFDPSFVDKVDFFFKKIVNHIRFRILQVIDK